MENITEKQCNGCMACLNICHADAIVVGKDEYGFYTPHINESVCINCSACIRACPLNDSDMEDVYINKEKFTAFAAQNKNQEIRAQSSSGGIFSILAEEIWDAGGVVYGVEFSDGFKAVHMRRDKKGNFFSGSKYVQSYVGTIYREVKKDLNSGRRALFSGTPCEIIGLKKYLNQEYENLITVDFICHGVPSPDIWDRYATCFMKRYGDNIRISFRDKNLSWNEFSLTVRDKEDNILYSNSLSEDPYLKAFLKNITLCEACANCNFRGSNRKSDITLADFWNVEEYFSEFNDNAGTSAIIINSVPGKKLLEMVKAQLVYREFYDYHLLLTGNPTYMKPQTLSTKRNKFFKEIQEADKDVTYLLTKYTKESIWERGKRRVKQDIHKIIKNLKSTE